VIKIGSKPFLPPFQRDEAETPEGRPCNEDRPIGTFRKRI